MNNPYNFLREAEEDAKIEIDYDALTDLRHKTFGVEDEALLADEKEIIVFYCKDCKQLVDANRLPSSAKRPKVQFCCAVCKGKNVFYGTRRGIEKYFHMK